MNYESNMGRPQSLQETLGNRSLEEVIIPDDVLQVSWETSTEIPIPNVEEAWERIKHMGLVGSEDDGGETGAGWGIPTRYNRFMPGKLQSTDTLEGTRVMEVSTRLRDAPKGSYVVTWEVDDVGMSILWERDWPEKVPDKEPMHYTYRITLEPGVEGTIIIKTGMRATNVSHPQLMSKLAPGIDSKAMKLFGEELTELVDPEQAKLMRANRTRRHVGYAAAAGVGIVGLRLLRKRK